MIRNIGFPVAILLTLIGGILVKPAFFDSLSILLTLGGATAVTCFSYSGKQLRAALRAIGAVFTARESNIQDHVTELRRLTALLRLHGLKALESQERHIRDPFLRQGVELLVDLYNEDMVRAHMEHRLACAAGEHEINRQILTTMGRLLPSFGLIGTLIGMVLLLGNLKSADLQTLPSALGLAVLTTLYGAIAANVFVAPLLARLQTIAVEQETAMRLTKDWVLMMLRGETGVIVDRRKHAPPRIESRRVKFGEITSIDLAEQHR
jgi:chemotaxis protein MotA